MRRLFQLGFCAFVLTWTIPPGAAQPSPPPARAAATVAPAPAANTPAQEAATQTNNNAAAAVADAHAVPPHPPNFLEHLVDVILELFNVRTSGNTTTHYAISLLILVIALLFRRILIGIIFAQLRRFAARTQTTLDDKLLPALEAPAATFVMVVGIFAALNVLKLSTDANRYVDYGSTVAFSLVVFWALWRAFDAVLDHGQEIAIEKGLGIAAFMPWIKKTLLTVFVVVGVLLIAQSLGFEVKAFLAGLGIGGLAFALAAQDTIANLFGSIVVAIDQPFKIGDAVKIAASEGVVEDIGLRSTRLRTPAKNLIIIPNKTVAAEAITNNSRFTQRRVEQVISLTYDTDAAQIEAIVGEFRKLILAEPEVDPTSVMVYFRDYSESSLDLWVVYLSKDPDFQKHMALRQRINLGMMRAVEAHQLSFAFPTQTMHLDGPVAQQLAGKLGSDGPPKN